MPDLSQQDREIIAKYPLGGSLDFLRDRLRDEQPATDSHSHDHKKAISLLLAALMGHEAAYNLESKGSSADLVSQLSQAFVRIRTGPFNHEYFRPLVLSVTENAPDPAIWEAVFSLLETLSHVTPPPSAPASLDATPVVRSSSSFQGGEQTRKILDPALFYEIQHCTYRNVEGFFEKYFLNKSWDEKSEEILMSIKRKKKKQKKKWHHLGRWTGISDRPTEDRMWEWLFFPGRISPRLIWCVLCSQEYERACWWGSEASAGRSYEEAN